IIGIVLHLEPLKHISGRPYRGCTNGFQ
ncbi:hypothetical protein ACJX0J_041623, partial [Zea mays]